MEIIERGTRDIKIEFFLESMLLELLKTKSIDSIHVKDIIRELGICKGTFYKYYQDKYDLATKTFERFFYAGLPTETWQAFVMGSLRAFRRSPEAVYNAFLSSDINSIAHYHGEKIKRLVFVERARRNLPLEGIQYLHAVNILVRLINETTISWLKGGCAESEEESLSMIEQLMPAVLCDTEG